MAVLVERIAQFNLFKNLPISILEPIAANVDFVRVEDKTVLLRHGSQPNSIIFLESGQLQISDLASDGRVIGIRLMNAGDVFGHLPLIDGLPVNCIVQSSKSAGILLWSLSNARSSIGNSPELMARIARLLALDFRRAISDKGLLSVSNAYHRIFIHIHALTNEGLRGNRATQLPNQKDIASVVNTSRETVSRALQLLIKGGVLGKAGHELVVHKAELLEKLAIDGLDALESNSS
jgi:CRP-like cAMP-binding protein